jgi:hypothetical protein
LKKERYTAVANNATVNMTAAMVAYPTTVLREAEGSLGSLPLIRSGVLGGGYVYAGGVSSGTMLGMGGSSCRDTTVGNASVIVPQAQS